MPQKGDVEAIIFEGRANGKLSEHVTYDSVKSRLRKLAYEAGKEE